MSQVLQHLRKVVVMRPLRANYLKSQAAIKEETEQQKVVIAEITDQIRKAFAQTLTMQICEKLEQKGTVNNRISSNKSSNKYIAHSMQYGLTNNNKYRIWCQVQDQSLSIPLKCEHLSIYKKLDLSKLRIDLNEEVDDVITFLQENNIEVTEDKIRLKDLPSK